MKQLILILFSVLSFSVMAEQLPSFEVKDIKAPHPAFPSDTGPIYRAETNKSYTLMIFSQVYCGPCKPIIADIPRVYKEVGYKTTIRIVVLGRYSQDVQDYANQDSLKDVFVANTRSASTLDIRYTPTLILATPTGEVKIRKTDNGITNSDLTSVINWIKTH